MSISGFDHLVSRPSHANRGFGMTPMEQGLRVGNAEFGGLNQRVKI